MVSFREPKPVYLLSGGRSGSGFNLSAFSTGVSVPTVAALSVSVTRRLESSRRTTAGTVSISSTLTLRTTGTTDTGGLSGLQGTGDHLLRKAEKSTEELNALVGEVPVIPLPREGLSDVTARLEGLHQLDDVEVAARHMGVLSGVVVLLGDHNTLFEEVLGDGDTIFGRDEHD